MWSFARSRNARDVGGIERARERALQGLAHRDAARDDVGPQCVAGLQQRRAPRTGGGVDGGQQRGQRVAFGGERFRFRCQRRRIERERVGGAHGDAACVGGGAAQARASGRGDERCVERGEELREAALLDQRGVAGERALGEFARRDRKDRRIGRVDRRLRDDSRRRGLPGFARAVAVGHAPQIDLRLDDEHALDVAPDDAENEASPSVNGCCVSIR